MFGKENLPYKNRLFLQPCIFHKSNTEPMGIITIKWPYETDPDWNEGISDDVRLAFQIAKKYKMDHRFISSSSFIEWKCDEKTALTIKNEVEALFPIIKVSWRQNEI